MKFTLKDFMPLLGLLAAIWIVEAANLLTGHSMSNWGIYPRHVSGLVGIPLSPFLHAGVGHAVSNTLPLLVLGGLTLIGGRGKFWPVTIGIVFLSGFMVWLFARGSLHVGASGLVFGYFGVLLARAFFERTLLAIAAAVVTMALYGGILWGILPLRSYVSFEGHFFGLVAGVAMVWFDHRRSKK